jgi:dipeptidyl aminopeptidase/acylaminoacyl peptidase
VTPADLARLVLASDPQFHPDGVRVGFVVGRPDFEADRVERSIWVAGDGVPRRFSAGPEDAAPRWAPDGSRLAFLRGSPGQVAVMPVGGGEATVVTDFAQGVESLAWSPDGSRLVVVGLTWTEEWEGLETAERERRPARIRRFPYRFDNKGSFHDRRRHLWLVDPAGAEAPRCLTPGEFDETEPVWSPNGSRIAFLTDRHPQGGLVEGVDVCEVDVATGEIRHLTERGMWVLVSYRPDGVPHLIGSPRLDWPVVLGLWRVGEGGPEEVAPGLDRALTSLAAGPPRLEWDGPTALAAFEDSGRVGVVGIDPAGSVTALVAGDRVVTGWAAAGSRLAFTASEATSPGELYLADGGEEQCLTRLNGGAELGLVAGDHFRVASDGWEIDAWVFLPPGSDPVPLLLNIHGGPASQYGFGFFDEFQVYAGAGFGVVACNPRGSSGRGEAFQRAVAGDGWGVVDLADITAVVEAALARHPRLDGGRMGIMGGSYGGFLTAWTIAADRRWRSAVVERALISFPSFSGTSDIGPTFPRHYTGVDFPDGWDAWQARSPIAHAHRTATPTLILHSERDYRCPIEQAEQYFVTLLRAGVETEFLRFPGEGHEMSRSGKPRHRRERLEAIIDWHRRHLA